MTEVLVDAVDHGVELFILRHANGEEVVDAVVVHHAGDIVRRWIQVGVELVGWVENGHALIAREGSTNDSIALLRCGTRVIDCVLSGVDGKQVGEVARAPSQFRHCDVL